MSVNNSSAHSSEDSRVNEWFYILEQQVFKLIAFNFTPARVLHFIIFEYDRFKIHDDVINIFLD